MTIQEQIELDVAIVTANPQLRGRLFDFLQTLKAEGPLRPNIDKVLACAGSIGDDEAQEVMRAIREPIVDEQSFNRLLDWIEKQLDSPPAQDTEAGRDLQLALSLVKDYEDIHCPFNRDDN